MVGPSPPELNGSRKSRDGLGAGFAGAAAGEVLPEL